MKATEQRGVLLAVVLSAFWLSACGGPDIGVTDEEILIGTWAPMTGPAASLGAIAVGMDAYFKYVNDEGGIHGRKLKLIIKDDGYDSSRTPEIAKQLVEEDKVFAICGGVGTSSCMAVKDYLATKWIPWVNPGSGSRVWTSPTQAYIFSVFPSYVTEGRILARHAAEELKAEKVGLFFQDDSFGREGQEGVSLGLGDAQKGLAVAVPYGRNDEDFSTHAQKFKDAEVDAVVLWSTPSKAGALIEEFKKLEFQPKLLASQVLADPVMFDLAGDAWEGAVVATGVPDPNSDEPGVVRAREIMGKYAPETPVGTYALMGMSWADVLAEGIRQAGPDLTRVRLIYTLERLESNGDNILGKAIQFSPENHHGFNAVRLLKAEGDKYVYLTDWIES
jgi:ABC-type branched-subunit amino acid transport system substrate-binding protein